MYGTHVQGKFRNLALNTTLAMPLSSIFISTSMKESVFVRKKKEKEKREKRKQRKGKLFNEFTRVSFSCGRGSKPRKESEIRFLEMKTAARHGTLS